MWRTIGALLSRAGESLGIELPEAPDLTALGDAVTGATEAVGDAATGAAETVGDAGRDVVDPLAALATDPDTESPAG